MKTQAVIKPKRPCVLRSVAVGTRRLIFFASLRDVLEIASTPNDPVTVTVPQAAKLSNLSSRTINRMVAAGKPNADAEQFEAA